MCVCIYIYIYICCNIGAQITICYKTIWFPMYINVCCIYQDLLTIWHTKALLAAPVLSNRWRKRLRQSRKGVPLPEALEPKPGRKSRGVCPGRRCSFQLFPSLPWPIIDAIDYYIIYIYQLICPYLRLLVVNKPVFVARSALGELGKSLWWGFPNSWRIKSKLRKCGQEAHAIRPRVDQLWGPQALQNSSSGRWG